MTINVTTIPDIDKVGVIKDRPAISLPPNAWSDARNVRFDDGAIRKIKGSVEVAGTTSGTSLGGYIKSIFHWNSPIGTLYVVGYTASGSDQLALVTVDANGMRAEHVKSKSGGYSAAGIWQFTTFNGGYSIIANNGIDAPQYLTYNQSSILGDTDNLFADLPNWTGYQASDTDVATVSAGIVTAFGSVLLAADLQERDSGQVLVRDLAGVVRSSSVAPLGAIPENWNPFATGAGTADELLLADTGAITALVELQGNMYAYTDNSIHQVQVGDNGLSTIPVTNQYGALSQRGVFEFDGQHMIVGSNDIYTFGGHPGSIKSISDGRVRRYFYDSLNPIHFENLSCVRNLAYDEIWICFPNKQSVAGELNEALIWNYRDNTWTIRDLNGLFSVTSAPVPGGGISGFTLNLGTSSTVTGDWSVNTAGTPASTNFKAPATVAARHTGVSEEEAYNMATPAVTAFTAQAPERWALEIFGDAGPDTVAAVNTITLPDQGFTYNASTLNGGALLTATINGVTYRFPANAMSGLSGTTTAAQLATAWAAYVNTNALAGFNFSASASGRVVTFTADGPGTQTFTAATYTVYTGTTVAINDAAGDTDESVSMTSTAATLNVNTTYQSSGANANQATGVTGVTWTVDTDTSTPSATVSGGNGIAINPNFEKW